MKKGCVEKVRVISGERKGHRLKAVPGTATRPTTDKVKEAIFNIIGPYFDGGTALDLYGGSGGLGIEALSRGVSKVIFIDQSRKAIETIKENLTNCYYMEKAEVYRNDSTRAIKALIKRELSFSFIFLDPPYANQQLVSEIGIITDNGLLQKDGTIIAEHTAELHLPDQIGLVDCIERKTYGETTISIFRFNKEIS